MPGMRLNAPSFGLVFAFLFLTLVVSGSVNWYNGLVLLYICSCSYITGLYMVPAKLRHLFSPVTLSFFAICAGGCLFSLLPFVTLNAGLILVIMGLLAATLAVINRGSMLFERSLSPVYIASYILGLLYMLLISKGELAAEFAKEQVGSLANTDPLYFTAVAASIRKGSILDAIFESGTPIIYQDLGFIWPALLGRLLKISTHQALWGLAQPVYKMLAILLPYDLYRSFFKERDRGNEYAFMLAALSFPILLAPLHPLYLAKLHVDNFIFSGLAYLLPAGTVTYPASIVLVMVSLLAFFNIDWQQRGHAREKMFFAAVLALVIAAKTPMFIASFAFYGVIVLYRIVIRREPVNNYLLYIMSSLVISAVAYKICFGYPFLGKFAIRYGYLVEYFGELYHKSPVGLKNHLLILCLVLATYILWLGIRLLGFAGFVAARTQRFTEVFVGASSAILFTTVIALIARMEVVNLEGVVTRDASFDTQQFIRSGFYIASLVSGMGLLYLVINIQRRRLRLGITALTILWCGAAFTTLASKPVPLPKNEQWYQENYAVLKSGALANGYIAVNPLVSTYGLMLSSSDEGQYWTAMGQAPGCYNAYKGHVYRWNLFTSLVNRPANTVLDSLVQEKVRYVIITPVDSAKLNKLPALFPDRISRLRGTNWVLEVLR